MITKCHKITSNVTNFLARLWSKTVMPRITLRYTFGCVPCLGPIASQQLRTLLFWFFRSANCHFTVSTVTHTLVFLKPPSTHCLSNWNGFVWIRVPWIHFIVGVLIIPQSSFLHIHVHILHSFTVHQLHIQVKSDSTQRHKPSWYKCKLL